MIVKCDACQTRFRIPDEKVTDKGVKVRCTKCQTTFRVTRPAPAAAEPAAPLPPPVPEVSAPAASPAFDPFAAFGPAETPSLDDATRPFTLSPAAMAKLGLTPPGAPPASEPPAPAASPGSGGSAFGDDFFSEPTRVGGNPLPRETASPAGPPPLPRAPAQTHDPFALLDATQPGFGGARPSPFEATQPGHPAGPADPFAQPSPFEGTQPGVAAPQDFDVAADFAATASEFGSPGADFGAQPAAFGELSSPGFGMPSAFSEGTQPGFETTGRVDRSAFDGSGDALDPSASTGTFPRPVDRAMFEMPPPSAQTGGLLDDVPPSYGGAEGVQEEVTATGIIAPAPAAPPPASEPTRVGPAPRPEPAPKAAPPATSAFRSFGGAIANIAAAVLLLSGVAAVAGVYLNGGRVDLASLSPDHLQHVWTRTGDVVPRDVSNGLYDTQGGHAVLYVRGYVENRTGRAGKVKVTAEIYDGDQLLRPASVYAGQSPTPEELAAISGQPDLEALVARLNQGAQVVAPGKRVPFLVPFYEYPTDLTGLRMKVTTSAPESAPVKR